MHQDVEGGSPRVVALYRYPIKGLTPEQVDRAALKVGQTMLNDRRYAIENGPGRFDPAAPRHLPKVNFLMLMRNERLATLKSTYDDESEMLTIHRDGRQVARGQLSTKIGRQLIEQFLAAYMKDDLRGAPRIMEAPGHSFSDVSAKCLHIINLASLRMLERAAGRSIDPLRFRANVIVDGLPPWAEFGWIDKTVRLGDVDFSVFARTERCAATEVDPTTAARDLAVPSLLQRSFGHTDFGIYAKVVSDGDLAIGDAISVAT